MRIEIPKEVIIVSKIDEAIRKLKSNIIEMYLFRYKINPKKIFSPKDENHIYDLALELSILNKEELNEITEIRSIRNKIQHENKKIQNKQEIEEILEKIEFILKIYNRLEDILFDSRI